MANEEAIAVLDKFNRVRLVRWFNLSYKPAVEKAVQEGKFSRYTANKLLAPCEHLERQRIPSAVPMKEVLDAWKRR